MAEPPENTDGRPSMGPFLAALAVVVVVLIGIGLFNLLGRDGPSDEQLVARAAVAQNDALQRESYSDYRSHTCRAQHGNETEIIGRQQSSTAQRGARFVDDVTDVVIDGDRATAEVTYHFDDSPDDTTAASMTFVREDGAWKVCSTGPR